MELMNLNICGAAVDRTAEKLFRPQRWAKAERLGWINDLQLGAGSFPLDECVKDRPLLRPGDDQNMPGTNERNGAEIVGWRE
jgi:hypothetical protein